MNGPELAARLWPSPFEARPSAERLRVTEGGERHAARIASSLGNLSALRAGKKLILARQTGLIFSGVLLFEGRLLETILKTEQRTAGAGDAASAAVRIGEPARAFG
jgi:hypothetical protein